jgi:membrane-associated phospholipid phosphatase
MRVCPGRSIGRASAWAPLLPALSRPASAALTGFGAPYVDVARRPLRARPSRGRLDAALVLIGAVLLVLSALPVDRHTVVSAERSVFRLVNDHTVLPFVVIWPVMQLGNFLVIPVVALVAAVARRWRLAFGILLGGLAAYFAAKQVKKIVPRGRPADLLGGVHIRGAAAQGRGYVSGHAAVVTLIAALAWPYLGKRSRAAVVAAAVTVCFARVYVAAHLPLDVVGGAALGLAVAGLVRLLVGRPA